jgi:two-component system NtrC family sensor kinase
VGGYGEDSPLSEEILRDLLRGLSDSLVEAVETPLPDGFKTDSGGNGGKDAFAAIGFPEPGRHGDREIPPAAFIALMKSFRSGFVDLVIESGLEPVDEAAACRFVERFFDRVEVDFLAARREADEALREEKKRLEAAQAELLARHDELSRLYGLVSAAKREWEGTMDCVEEMVFMTDDSSRVRRGNRAFQKLIGRPFPEFLGIGVAELFESMGIPVETAGKDEIEFLHAPSGRWFHLRRYPFRLSVSDLCRAENPETSGAVVTLIDITERKRHVEEIAAQNARLNEAYDQLRMSQARILQQEKLASIGQLAAGVAHEINNPMGFIASNLGTLKKYSDRLGCFIAVQEKALAAAGAVPEEVRKARGELKIDRICGDLQALVDESLEGAERVRKIVQNLKSFSRVDQAEFKHADINECIESTINIVWNEIKYKATLHRDFGLLPQIRCYPQQLNQVFMNILVNAAQAIGEKGEIRVRSRAEDGFVCVEISDTGCGIPPENLGRLFEPFFTTKEVGKGTGLGLSIAYDIIKKHNGEILVHSKVGKGTVFALKIPVVDPK